MTRNFIICLSKFSPWYNCKTSSDVGHAHHPVLRSVFFTSRSLQLLFLLLVSSYIIGLPSNATF